MNMHRSRKASERPIPHGARGFEAATFDRVTHRSSIVYYHRILIGGEGWFASSLVDRKLLPRRKILANPVVPLRNFQFMAKCIGLIIGELSVLNTGS